MMRSVALLRGINVGGKHRLPMTDLVAIFAGLGHTGIHTYIQSGNVVFDHAVPADAATITRAIEEAHGFAPHVLVLDAAAWRAVIAANPYPAGGGKALHVFFFDTAPDAPDRTKLEALKSPTEAFTLGASALYLNAPEGIGRSKLAAGVEKALGVPVTARNGNTLAQISALLAQPATDQA